MAEGLSNKLIAERLGISDQTVKFHVASVCGKLDALNRTDASAPRPATWTNRTLTAESPRNPWNLWNP